jgi:hypothetical protein
LEPGRFRIASEPAKVYEFQRGADRKMLGKRHRGRRERARIRSPSLLHGMNDDAMTKQSEPSEESLEEMPEIDDQRFRRLPGRGHHVNRSVGEIVTIDAELWAHFGSAEAVNDALRRVVAEGKKAAGS